MDRLHDILVTLGTDYKLFRIGVTGIDEIIQNGNQIV
jgi:hypothetical protein